MNLRTITTVLITFLLGVGLLNIGVSLASTQRSAAAETSLIQDPAAAYTLPVITPILECVVDLGGGNFRAVFGYANSGAATVIPVGTSNRFSPAPQARGQVTTFLAGRQTAVFTVDFLGTSQVTSLTWRVTSRRQLTATASKNSPRCVTPTPTNTPTNTPLPPTATATDTPTNTPIPPTPTVTDTPTNTPIPPTPTVTDTPTNTPIPPTPTVTDTPTNTPEPP